MERVHGLGGQLNLALARFAILELLDVLCLQSESVEVGEFRRIAELLDGQITGKLAQCINIRCKLEIFLWSGVDIYRPENKHLVRRPGFEYLGHRFSVSNGGNLAFIQTGVLLEKLEGLCTLRSCGGLLNQEKHNPSNGEQHEAESGSQFCFHCASNPGTRPTVRSSSACANKYPRLACRRSAL